MKTTLTLREIAEKNGLTYIETTSERSGYPANIEGAIIGFDTFEQCREIAEKQNLSIESFKKKDGWQLWFRTGNTASEAFSNSAEDYGDNYAEFSNISADTFFEDEVKDVLVNFNNFEELQKFIDEKKELLNEIESAKDGQLVIANEGRYYETIDAYSMIFCHDTNTYVIGLIDRG